jgi:hypothetical protein
MPWIITTDHLATIDDTINRTGRKTKGWTPALEPTAVPFRLYDDDGELYFTGLIARASLDGDESAAFGPLNFGAADAGCTRMDFFEHGGWKTL